MLKFICNLFRFGHKKEVEENIKFSIHSESKYYAWLKMESVATTVTLEYLDVLLDSGYECFYIQNDESQLMLCKKVQKDEIFSEEK